VGGSSTDGKSAFALGRDAAGGFALSEFNRLSGGWVSTGATAAALNLTAAGLGWAPFSMYLSSVSATRYLWVAAVDAGNSYRVLYRAPDMRVEMVPPLAR
jgi:hypothetical protein